jgi:hypothetical protein
MSPYVAVAATLGICLLCCGTSVTAGDASLDGASDALTCGPSSVSGFVPTAMHPPNPLHQNACTVKQTSDYAACNSQVDPTQCPQFGGQPVPGTPPACAACIESQVAAATWGVIVFTGTPEAPGVGEVNIGGCVDDALGQVAAEPNSCGQLLFSSYSCQNAACGGCTGNQFDQCDLLALAGGVGPTLATTCKSFDDQVESTTGPCAAIAGDVLPAAVGPCFPDASLAGNLAQQDEDWLTRIACFMCGPPNQDTEGKSCP